jgi:3-hydroxyacyl-CoA dehydrogenase
LDILYTVRDGVAVIVLDNPPVNALGRPARKGLVDALDRAADDGEVAAIVLMGAGRMFSAGADIQELDSRRAWDAPTLSTVVECIEFHLKPVVAAIHSMALGGGLELALAAHYRIAQRDAVVGLPEIKLGLLPGCGGTQRLPRAVGLERALNMIVTGEPVKVGQLEQTRLFDRIVETDLLTNAVALAREVSARGGAHPRIRDRPVASPDVRFNAEGFVSCARAVAATATPGMRRAAEKCVDSLEATLHLSFDDALEFERNAFRALLQTPESRSLRHALRSERAAARTVISENTLPLRAIRSAAVVGAGTMGGGISMSLLNAGIPVTLIEAKSEALERGVNAIRANYQASVRKGKLSADEEQRRLALLRHSLDFQDLRDADLVIEAVFEEYGVKEKVFKQLDALCRPGAILATNTSTLDLDRIAALTSRPQDVVGLHFFSPANVMKLLEVVRGARTAADVLATVLVLAGRIGKIPVVSGVCDGFIGNRMLDPYFRQAGFLLDEGALPAQVDRAIERFGFAMGPFRMSDLAGNDISWAIRRRKAISHPQQVNSRIPDRICELGRFGQKTGAGWYDYEPGGRTARPSKEVESLIVEHARDIGVHRRTIGDDEIVARLVYSLVNEGARILEEGIAQSAADIDVVYLAGYGFPRWRGGPMFYADEVGLYDVLRAIQRFARGYQGQEWVPAQRLLRLAEVGQGFNT